MFRSLISSLLAFRLYGRMKIRRWYYTRNFHNTTNETRVTVIYIELAIDDEKFSHINFNLLFRPNFVPSADLPGVAGVESICESCRNMSWNIKYYRALINADVH